MNIQENFSLKNYHTFGIEIQSRFFVEVTSLESLQTLLTDPAWQNIPWLILGEGSNVLFSQDFPGLVIKISLKGIQQTSEDGLHVWINVAAGENWHQLVLFCIENHLAGVENLSLIPGSVGAAPIQNIGAYGVEFSEVFESLTAIRLSDGKLCNFDKTACRFGYRESIFKKEFKNKYVIASVNLRLNKTPLLRIEYGAIKETLASMQIKQINIQAISKAIIHIRQQKLPDPKKIGNAGSFFLSPVLSKKKFLEIYKRYPTMPYFINENNYYKIPAGWFIEQCGWKGRRLGDAGVHEHHALVLVNYGKSSGKDVKYLAEEIQAAVKEKFSVELTPEVNII